MILMESVANFDEMIKLNYYIAVFCWDSKWNFSYVSTPLLSIDVAKVLPL